MEALQSVLETFGLATAALAFVAICVWRSGKFLAHRLFDEDKGLITKWVRDNAKTQECYQGFMARTEKFNLEHLAQTDLNVNDLTQLKKAALEGCQFCRALSTAYPEQQEVLNKHVDEMERIIESR